MGQHQQAINIKILEGMVVVSRYNFERGRLIVSESRKISKVVITPSEIDAAMASFEQDNLILNYCGL